MGGGFSTTSDSPATARRPAPPVTSGRALVRGFAITEGEKADLIAFLESLTDAELLEYPRFSDPWNN